MKRGLFRGLAAGAAVLLFAAAAAVWLLPLPGDISVLMYHFAGNSEEAARDKNILTLKSFERQMGYLKFFGYRVISAEDYEAIRTGARRPRGREVMLTFDDGNESYARDFLPVLERLGFPSTVFLVSESVEKKLHGSMTVETVRAIAGHPQVTLGGHTRTHPFLTEVDPARLQEELERSKQDLEIWFGKPILYFSYPFGALNESVIQAVQKAGYHLAFTTSPKKLGMIPEGPYSITRVKMTSSEDHPVRFVGMTSGIYHNFKRFRQKLKASSSRAP